MASIKKSNAEPAEPARLTLLSREEIERCMQPGASSVIGPDEAHGYLISVVVGAGVYRPITVAGLFRILGKGGRLDPSPRRAEMVKTLLKSPSEDLLQLATTVFEAAKELSNCTILVDQSGLGTHFIKILEILGAKRVIANSWGREPNDLQHRKRFFNLRAQCSVHAAEALKDRRLLLAGDPDLIEQGSTLPFYFDAEGRYHMVPKEKMLGDSSVWDVVAMAFLESADCVAAQ